MKKVAVIGGGVIGQYISWKLSRTGYSVSVFDYRKKECLKDKACSVLVSERIKDFIPITDDIIEERCHSVLIYLYPDYKKMSARQYNNAFEALRTIYYGTPLNNLKTK